MLANNAPCCARTRGCARRCLAPQSAAASHAHAHAPPPPPPPPPSRAQRCRLTRRWQLHAAGKGFGKASSSEPSSGGPTPSQGAVFCACRDGVAPCAHLAPCACCAEALKRARETQLSASELLVRAAASRARARLLRRSC
jgi:hypothetical protein